VAKKPVAEYAYIGSRTKEEVERDQPVGSAMRMVGNNKEGAVGRHAGEIAVGP
jgi:hypothetical protein